MNATESEGNLYEETLNLIKELDETDDPVKAALLQARIVDRSDDLGDLSGWALQAADGDLLVACLDQDQARAVQLQLLMIDGGMVTTVVELLAPIIDFVHPAQNPAMVAAMLLAD